MKGLSERIPDLLLRRGPQSHAAIHAACRHDCGENIDDALRYLRSVGLIYCSNGIWSFRETSLLGSGSLTVLPSRKQGAR
jgi:hypothetical protein